MNRLQAQVEVRALSPIEMVESVAAYFESLASGVVKDAADAEAAEFRCAVDYWKTCQALVADLRFSIGKYERAVLDHLNSDCNGH